MRPLPQPALQRHGRFAERLEGGLVQATKRILTLDVPVTRWRVLLEKVPAI
jgi:hypothetical protein